MAPTDDAPETLTEFRARVRAFFADLPNLLDRHDGTMARAKAFRRALCDEGLAGISYPTDVGGAGLPAEYELSLIHISEPTRQESRSRMPSSA